MKLPFEPTSLTVIIPTINRESIIDAVESIDIDCNLIISLDASQKRLLHRINRPYKVVAGNIPNNPASTKNAGISYVTTKYFIILDDDDQFVPGFLSFALNAMENNPKANWLSTHWDERLEGDFEYEVVDNVISRYFDWDKYDLDHCKNSIYPNSSILVRTDSWNLLYPISINNDDIVPCTYFMLHNPGIHHFGSGFRISRSNNSVSRRIPDISSPRYFGLFKVILRHSMDNKFWDKVLINALNIVRHAKFSSESN